MPLLGGGGGKCQINTGECNYVQFRNVAVKTIVQLFLCS